MQKGNVQNLILKNYCPNYFQTYFSFQNYDPCNDCHKNADCVVSGYSRKCVCKEGYSGNGQVCDYEEKENYPEPTQRPYG